MHPWRFSTLTKNELAIFLTGSPDKKRETVCLNGHEMLFLRKRDTLVKAQKQGAAGRSKLHLAVLRAAHCARALSKLSCRTGLFRVGRPAMPGKEAKRRRVEARAAKAAGGEPEPKAPQPEVKAPQPETKAPPPEGAAAGANGGGGAGASGGGGETGLVVALRLDRIVVVENCIGLVKNLTAQLSVAPPPCVKRCCSFFFVRTCQY